MYPIVKSSVGKIVPARTLFKLGTLLLEQFLLHNRTTLLNYLVKDLIRTQLLEALILGIGAVLRFSG